MQNNLPSVDAPIEALDAARAIAAHAVEAIVTDLELLTDESPIAIRADLVTLHGALLAYEVGGVADSLPSIGFGMSGRRILERRVVRAAKSLIGESHAALAVKVAASKIEELIHLVDPELRGLAA